MAHEMGIVVPFPTDRYEIGEVADEDGHRLSVVSPSSATTGFIKSIEGRPDFASADRTYTVKMAAKGGGVGLYYEKDGAARGRMAENIFEAAVSDEPLSNYRLSFVDPDLYAVAVMAGVSGAELRLLRFYEKTRKWRRVGTIAQGADYSSSIGLVRDGDDVLAYALFSGTVLKVYRSRDLKTWSLDALIDLGAVASDLHRVELFRGGGYFYMSVISYTDRLAGKAKIQVVRAEIVPLLGQAFLNEDIGPFPPGITGAQLISEEAVRASVFFEFDNRLLLLLGFEGTTNYLSLFKLSTTLETFVAMPNTNSVLQVPEAAFSGLSIGRFSFDGDTRCFFFRPSSVVRSARVAVQQLTPSEQQVDVDGDSVGYSLSSLGGPRNFLPLEMSGAVARDQVYLAMRFPQKVVTARSLFWSQIPEQIPYESGDSGRDWIAATGVLPEVSQQGMSSFVRATPPASFKGAVVLDGDHVEILHPGDAGVDVGWAVSLPIDSAVGAKIRFRMAVGGRVQASALRTGNRTSVRARYGSVSVFDWRLDFYEDRAELFSGSVVASTSGNFTEPRDYMVLLQGSQVELLIQKDEWGGKWESLFSVGLSPQAVPVQTFLEFGHFSEPGSSRWFRFAAAPAYDKPSPSAQQSLLTFQAAGIHYLGDGISLDVRSGIASDSWTLSPRITGGEGEALLDDATETAWRSLHDRMDEAVTFRDVSNARFRVDSVGLVDFNAVSMAAEAADTAFSALEDPGKRTRVSGFVTNFSVADTMSSSSLIEAGADFATGYWRERKIVLYANDIFDRELPGSDGTAYVGIDATTNDIAFVRTELVGSILRVSSRVAHGGLATQAYAAVPFHSEDVDATAFALDPFGYDPFSTAIMFLSDSSSLAAFALLPSGLGLKRLLLKASHDGTGWQAGDITSVFGTLVRPTLFRPVGGGEYLVGATVGNLLVHDISAGTTVTVVLSSPSVSVGAVQAVDVFRDDGRDRVAVFSADTLYLADLFPANISGLVQTSFVQAVDFFRIWASPVAGELVMSYQVPGGKAYTRRSMDGGTRWGGAVEVGDSFVDLLAYVDHRHHLDFASADDPVMSEPVGAVLKSGTLRLLERSSGVFDVPHVTEPLLSGYDTVSYLSVEMADQTSAWHGVLERNFGVRFQQVSGEMFRLVFSACRLSAGALKVGEARVAGMLLLSGDHPSLPFGETLDPNLRLLESPSGIQDVRARGILLRRFRFQYDVSPPDFFSQINRLYSLLGKVTPFMLMLDVDDPTSLVFVRFDSPLESEEGAGHRRTFGFEAQEVY